MTRFADPHSCPDCRSPLPPDPVVCASCDLPLRGPLAVALFNTLAEADRLLTQLRASSVSTASTASVAVPAMASTAGPAAPPTDAPPTDAPFTDASPAPRRRGLRGASVPSILLALGALCLLVAAVIFLAVAWSWLGVGGRTAVLVALTVTAAGVGSWLAGRGLRVAGESLTLVSLGLLALDAVGADNAGWTGHLSDAGLVCLVGGTLLCGALALMALPARLVTPELVAALGLWILVAGASGTTGHPQLVAALGVVAFAGLGLGGRLLGAPVLPWLAVVGGLTWWVSLAAQALADAADHASLHALWAQGHGLGLVAASALLLLPVPAAGSRRFVAPACGAAAATLGTLTAALPAVDESATALTVAALAFLAAWAGSALVLPGRWRPVALAPLTLSTLPVLAVAITLLGAATENVLSVADPFTSGAGVRLPVPLTLDADSALVVPCVVGVLLVLGAAYPDRVRAARPDSLRVALAATALAGVATLALHPVPLWTVTTGLELVAAALVADALLRADRTASMEAMVAGVIGTAAIAVALPSAVLTTVACAVLLLAAVGTLLAARFPFAADGAWLVVPAAGAGLIWSAAEVLGVDPAYRAAPILLVVGALAVLRPRPEAEASAILAGLVAAVAAVPAADEPTTSLALHLTLAGALVTISALVNPSRRHLGWLGGLLLAMATWVRLVDIGVEAPEAYTLPSAVALVLVGLRRLQVDPSASTRTALVPGLLLATTPSLLWVLADDVVSLRAVLLGLGCLGLVLAGATLRWSAPLVVGATVGAALVLRELAPYAGATPQWVLIGLAGTALTLVGITWERRMLEVRTAAAYLGRLR